ncbi:MAG: DUF2188 domain-containing protein [Flavobacteriales bacterium]|nr:DUF2188 domain-containing protein [Flavobacteriales bacterium]
MKVAGATKATATHTNKAEAVRYARAVGKKHYDACDPWP